MKDGMINVIKVNTKQTLYTQLIGFIYTQAPTNNSLTIINLTKQLRT